MLMTNQWYTLWESGVHTLHSCRMNNTCKTSPHVRAIRRCNVIMTPLWREWHLSSPLPRTPGFVRIPFSLLTFPSDMLREGMKGKDSFVQEIVYIESFLQCRMEGLHP